MPAPLVSVIVPFYNPGKYFRAALYSLLEQGYGPLELVAVDDKSTDGSLELAQDLLDRPEFRYAFGGGIKLLRNERNSGAFAAINRGIAASSGEYLNILNADDLFYTNRLQSIVEHMQSLPSSRHVLYFSRVVVIDEAGEDVGTISPEGSRLVAMQESIPFFPSVGFALLPYNVSISTGNLFFDRGLYDRLDGFAPLPYCHDWDFALRALLLTEPRYLEAPGYAYRLHATNTFRRLTSVRDSEAAAVQRSYFRAVATGNFENPVAPGPSTWPGVFESTLDLFGLTERWRSAHCD
jgi:glycosyltransferase involved in cell wall biosynthesis